MRRRPRWFNWLANGCLLLTILSLSIALAINFRPLYLADVRLLHIDETVGLNATTIIKNFDQLMHYLNTPWVTQLTMSDFPVSASGALHFFEVKRLFLLCYGVLLVTIIPSLSWLIFLWRTHQLWHLTNLFRVTLLVPIGFVGLIAVGFEQFFITFHHVFFNNDAWLFNPVTDPIINALPEAFFLHSFIVFFVILEGLLLLLWYLSKRSLRKS